MVTVSVDMIVKIMILVHEVMVVTYLCSGGDLVW